MYASLKRDFTLPLIHWKNGVTEITKDRHTVTTRTEDERTYRIASSKNGEKEHIDYNTLMSFADKLTKAAARWRQ